MAAAAGARPLAVFSASGGAALMSAGAGMSPGFGALGADGVAAAFASDGAICFGGGVLASLRSHVAPAASNNAMKDAGIMGCLVTSPLYHGRG
jgi:hypothetical protein